MAHTSQKPVFNPIPGQGQYESFREDPIPGPGRYVQKSIPDQYWVITSAEFIHKVPEELQQMKLRAREELHSLLYMPTVDFLPQLDPAITSQQSQVLQRYMEHVIFFLNPCHTPFCPFPVQHSSVAKSLTYLKGRWAYDPPSVKLKEIQLTGTVVLECYMRQN
jgi:hypothetical protein